jgi:hypothetical protein
MIPMATQLVWTRLDNGDYYAGVGAGTFNIVRSSGRFILLKVSTRVMRGSLAACKSEAQRLADAVAPTVEESPAPFAEADPCPTVETAAAPLTTGSGQTKESTSDTVADSQYDCSAEPFPVPMPSTDRLTTPFSPPVGRFGEETDPGRPDESPEMPVVVGNVGFDTLHAWSDERLGWNGGKPVDAGGFLGGMAKGEARKVRKMLRRKGLVGHSSAKRVCR